jgi:porin
MAFGTGSRSRALPVPRIALALALLWGSSAGAEPPPDADRGSTSLMTLMPILTPISDYGGDDWRSGACAFCFGAIGEQREKLYERGIALDASVTQVPQGVVSGGEDRVWKYGGNADYTLALDSDRLGLWPGGLVKLTGRTKFGRGVLRQAGNLSPVNYGWLLPSVADESESFLEEYFITQGLTDWAALVFGRLLMGNLGDTNRLAGHEQTQFVNTALRNSPLLAVLTSSLSVHAAALMLQPSSHFAIAPLALSRNDRDGEYGSPGGLFSEYSVGALVFTNWEIAGLPGEFNPVGGWTNKKTTAFDNPFLLLDILLGDIPQKDGNWLVGFSANQYFYVPEQPAEKEVRATPFILQPEGVGAFLRFHYAPEDRNLFNVFVSGGISGRGVIPGRPLDRYGVGFYGLFQSDEAQPTVIDLIEDEWGMEVFYNLAITPWLQFSPSVQYIDSGQVDVDHSVVVTIRLQMYF